MGGIFAQEGHKNPPSIDRDTQKAVEALTLRTPSLLLIDLMNLGPAVGPAKLYISRGTAQKDSISSASFDMSLRGDDRDLAAALSFPPFDRDAGPGGGVAAQSAALSSGSCDTHRTSNASASLPPPSPPRVPRLPGYASTPPRRGIFGRAAKKRYGVAAGERQESYRSPAADGADPLGIGEAGASMGGAGGRRQMRSAENEEEEVPVHDSEGDGAAHGGSNRSLVTESTGDDTALAANYPSGSHGDGDEDGTLDDDDESGTPDADENDEYGDSLSAPDAGGTDPPPAMTDPLTPGKNFRNNGDSLPADWSPVSPLTPYGHSPPTHRRRNLSHRPLEPPLIEEGVEYSIEYKGTKSAASGVPSPIVAVTNNNYGTLNGSSWMDADRSSLGDDENGGSGGTVNTGTLAQPDRWTQTLHAQSLLLGLAFLFIWSPQNLMAPNLTQMADYFHFSPAQRDLYLGANIAFATAVLSLPMSALIGFIADLVPSRKILYAATVFLGGVASVCTGLSRTYTQLYLARFVCGGCMSGSVPVVFSLLGDLFDTADRNTASSGLTAMMGAGIVLGQVWAGMVGDMRGWKYPFYVSGILSMLSSCLVLIFVREPVRGGKERVMQDMLANGVQYKRTITMKGFWHAMTRNESNLLLMAQGFFSSVPWGIVFTFLNDYLSQEQGLSVPDATFLVLVFGIGCGVGSILGGYLGQKCMEKNRKLLPQFMAASTFLAIPSYLAMLDATFDSASFLPCMYAFTGGCISSLPSVNVRPCIINVNPPHLRGATLTSANLIINFARGIGPSFITLSGRLPGLNRCKAMNLNFVVFWTITSIQLLMLSRCLPRDQDDMETELARYAESIVALSRGEGETAGGEINAESVSAAALGRHDESVSTIGTAVTINAPLLPRDAKSISSSLGALPIMINDGSSENNDGDFTVVSIEERMTSFDTVAARESLKFMETAFREFGGEVLRLSQDRGDLHRRSSLRHRRNSANLEHHRDNEQDGGENNGSGAVGGLGGEARRDRWRRGAHQIEGGGDGSKLNEAEPTPSGGMGLL